MPLLETISEQDHGALDEPVRALYVKAEKDGAVSYTLHPSIVEERTALANKNKQLLTEKQKKELSLQSFESLGMDAATLKSLVEAHQAAEDAKKTDEEKRALQLESLKTTHKNEYDALKNAAKERETFLMGQLRRHMIDAEASLAIEKAGVLEGSLEALLPHVVSAMSMLEDGEGDEKKFVTRIIGPDKQARYNGTDFMTVDHLVEELKKKPGFQGLFKATGKGGSGAPPQNNRTTTSARNISEMSANDKIKAGLANRTR
jgi:hypothetical protein